MIHITIHTSDLDETHMNTINVSPITRKAKNRFSNIMDENHTCTIEQVRDGMMFLTSSNRKNHFWVMVDNDPHWMLHWSHKGKEFAPSISKVTLRALRLIFLGFSVLVLWDLGWCPDLFYCIMFLWDCDVEWTLSQLSTPKNRFYLHPSTSGVSMPGLVPLWQLVAGGCFLPESRAGWPQLKPITMKTFFIAVLCLTVGTAYGQYFIDAIQAGTELVETARQS